MQPPKPMQPQGVERHLDDPRIRHERTDISVTGVVAFIVALGFSGIVIFTVLWAVFHFANSYAKAQDEKDLRDPWVRSAETQVDQEAESLRTRQNRSKEPGSMEMGDAEARVRITRFPQPRVQSDDVRDLTVMREAEDVYLNEYFVLDKNSGKVNIPIQAAMDAVVKKGLPAMQAASGIPLPPTAETTGMVRPSVGSSHAKETGSPIRER